RTVGWYDPIATPRADGAGAGGGGGSGSAGAGDGDVGVGAARPSKFVEHYRATEAEAAAAASAAVPRTAEARRFVLSNGLTLIVRRNAANPTIALQGLVKAGSIFDPPA